MSAWWRNASDTASREGMPSICAHCGGLGLRCLTLEGYAARRGIVVRIVCGKCRAWRQTAPGPGHELREAPDATDAIMLRHVLRGAARG